MKYIPIDIPGHWYIKLNQHLNTKEYGRLCRELAKPKYSVVKASAALKLFDAGKLQVKDKIRIIWIHDIETPCARLNPATSLCSSSIPLGGQTSWILNAGNNACAKVLFFTDNSGDKRRANSSFWLHPLLSVPLRSDDFCRFGAP